MAFLLQGLKDSVWPELCCQGTENLMAVPDFPDRALWNPTGLTPVAPPVKLPWPVGGEVLSSICLSLLTWSFMDCAPEEVTDVYLELVISPERGAVVFVGGLFRNE